jgi:hypothetical protein
MSLEICHVENKYTNNIQWHGMEYLWFCPTQVSKLTYSLVNVVAHIVTIHFIGENTKNKIVLKFHINFFILFSHI